MFREVSGNRCRQVNNLTRFIMIVFIFMGTKELEKTRENKKVSVGIEDLKTA